MASALLLRGNGRSALWALYRQFRTFPSRALAGTAAMKKARNNKHYTLRQLFILSPASCAQDTAADRVSPTILINGLWNLTPFLRQKIHARGLARRFPETAAFSRQFDQLAPPSFG